MARANENSYQMFSWPAFIFNKSNFCPASNYKFNFKNWNTKIKAMCEICSTLTIKTSKRHNWHLFWCLFMLPLNRFPSLLWCFHSWIWTGKYWLVSQSGFPLLNINRQANACSKFEKFQITFCNVFIVDFH